MYKNLDIAGRYMRNVYHFSKFRRFMPEKLPLFLDFANSRIPLKNYLFLRDSGYERGKRFDREWRGRAFDIPTP